MELLYKKVIFDELEKLEITLSESINSDIELATEVSGHIAVSYTHLTLPTTPYV